MKYNFCVGVSRSTADSFNSSQLAALIKEVGVDVFYFSDVEEFTTFSCSPFLIITDRNSDIFDLGDCDDRWFFKIGSIDANLSDKIFILDDLIGDTPCEIFKIIIQFYFNDLVNFIKKNAYERLKDIFKNSLETMSSVLTELKNRNFNDDVKNYLQLSSEFLIAHDQFYSSTDVNSIVSIFKDFARPHGIITDVQLVKGDDGKNFVKLHGNSYKFFPIIFDNVGDYIAYKADEREFGPKFIDCYLYSFIDILSRFVHSIDHYQSAISKRNLFEDIVGLVGMPIAMVSDKGELLLHNADFLKLGIPPNQCLSFADGVEFEKDQMLLKVVKKELTVCHQTVYFYTFLSIESSDVRRGKNISTEQLGIISSSIAHELNNPIAGILAALSLVELEDWWDDDSLNTIAEMKKSAERCGNLVQMFLGFSRSKKYGNRSDNFASAFSQSLNLVRFRLIESNLHFDITHLETKQEYLKEFKTSAVSMVFYLILSDVLTLFSHNKLVAGVENAHIKISVAEYSDRVEIEFDDFIDIADRINKSKLMAQLVDMEGITLYSNLNRIILQ